MAKAMRATTAIPAKTDNALPRDAIPWDGGGDFVGFVPLAVLGVGPAVDWVTPDGRRVAGHVVVVGVLPPDLQPARVKLAQLIRVLLAK